MSHATVKRDPDAQADFKRRHGIINSDIPLGNAEALIRAHAVSQSRAVQKASLLSIDNEATANLDLDDLADKVGATVLSAAVRGNAIVVVAEDENGRTFKDVLPANDRYVPPAEDAADAAAREMSQAELDFQAEVARLRQEQEAELAKMRAEMQDSFREQADKLREEILGGASDRAVKAAEEAEKAQESTSTDDGGTSVRNDPLQGGGPKQSAGSGGKSSGKGSGKGAGKKS